VYDPRAAGLRILGDENNPDGVCHRARYLWARDLLDPCSVVDYGCGTGYGTALLGQKHDAIGYEPDTAAAEWGSANWGAHIVTERPERAAAVVCFEVLEHLDAPPRETLRDLLELAPVVIGSVPFREPCMENPARNNPHHRWFMLDETNFSGFACEFWYQRADGTISATSDGAQNLLFRATRAG
jgi:hypothetical protein